MARGKYLSLEEARKMRGGLKRFTKEHPAKGDMKKFDRLLDAMTHGQPPTPKKKKASGRT